MGSTSQRAVRGSSWILSAMLFALGCATARPPLAASWCANEDDKACGQRYAALYERADLYGPDDGNREGMLGWFRYRCALDPNSTEAAAGANEPGLDCWRAGEVALAQGNATASRELEERGCEAFGWTDACVLAGEFAHEKYELREAHDWDCRAKKGAEEMGRPRPEFELLDCEPGSDTRARLQAGEKAKLGRPGAPVNLVLCALHGCTLPGGRYVKAWITSW